MLVRDVTQTAPDRRNQNPPIVETGIPIVETSDARPWKPVMTPQQRDAMTRRLAVGLKKLERSWSGKTIGIGFDADMDTGRITMTIGPEGPTFNLVVTAAVEDVRVGDTTEEFN